MVLLRVVGPDKRISACKICNVVTLRTAHSGTVNAVAQPCGQQCDCMGGACHVLALLALVVAAAAECPESYERVANAAELRSAVQNNFVGRVSTTERLTVCLEQCVLHPGVVYQVYWLGTSAFQFGFSA